MTNNSGITWGDFHFELGNITGFPASQVVFCDSTNPSCNDPYTSIVGATYNITNTGKYLDFYFYGNPLYNGQTATFNVYTDNTANHQPFSITAYPTVVPEPISSTLFILGGATLGLRRFWKKRLNA